MGVGARRCACKKSKSRQQVIIFVAVFCPVESRTCKPSATTSPVAGKATGRLLR